MAKNDFKTFATGENANVMSQEEWEALPALLSGFTAGKASSAQVNKVIRQASFIAAALAQFVSDKTQRDVLDNGDLPGFVELLGSGFAVEYLSRNNPFGDINSDGTVQTALGNLGLVDNSGVVGRLINTQVITSSGTYTPTSGTKKIKVILTGGGGGGSSVSATSFSQTAFGGGGGSGSTCIGFFDISSISNFSVVIGTGGTAGNSGGTSTFNGMSASPGGGGGGLSTPGNGGGGAPGTATGGLINIHGGYGSDGQVGSYYAFGNGAASFWGGGGRAGSGGGNAAAAYGSGGGAAYDTAFSGVLKSGGAGAPGVCVIEEFA